MRLVRFDDDRTGLLTVRDGSIHVLDIGSQLPDGSNWLRLIDDWGTWKPRLEGLLAAAEQDPGTLIPIETVQLRPPLPTLNARIFALGLNFASHVGNASQAIDVADPLEATEEKPLGGFYVIPGTVVGHEDDIAPPRLAEKLDYEAEVAVVLSSGGLNVGPEAFGIWGHTAFNDLSIRDPHLGVGLKTLDKGTLSWALQKNFQGGNVCGPWLTVDEGFDYGNLSIVSRVNGEQRQDGSTAQMIHSFAQGAAKLAAFVELRPGDLLTSGTPAGTAIEQGIDGPFLKPGDVIEIEVEGAGVLRNRIV